MENRYYTVVTIHDFYMHYRWVIHDEHSTSTTSRSWRYRAITVSVAICGPPDMEEELGGVLAGAKGDLDSLVIGNDDGLGDRRLTRQT